MFRLGDMCAVPYTVLVLGGSVGALDGSTVRHRQTDRQTDRQTGGQARQAGKGQRGGRRKRTVESVQTVDVILPRLSHGTLR
jgi:hypothetical protein